MNIPSCALDEGGLARQRERYRRIAPAATRIERRGDVLDIEFSPALDRKTLDELIAVERECCPFFTFELDARARRLEIGVQRPEQGPALAALEEQLAPGATAATG